MTMLGALGGFFFKKSSADSSYVIAIVKSKKLYIGCLLYTASAFINIWVLKYMPYSVVMPMTAITYIWTMMLSHFVLKEKITVKKMIGIASIIVGAAFISMY
jgi:drug/metabolite transporter (DMT)-like permease